MKDLQPDEPTARNDTSSHHVTPRGEAPDSDTTDPDTANSDTADNDTTDNNTADSVTGPPLYLKTIDAKTIDAVAEISNGIEPARQLAELLESMTDAFFSVDHTLCVTYVNSETERVLGRARHEILGKPLVDVLPEVAAPPFVAHYRRLLDTREPHVFTEYYPPLRRWFDVRTFPFATGLAVHFRDVTDAHRAQAALQAGEERFREIAESIEDAFWVWDVQADRILYVNPSYETIFGLPRAAIYADPYSYQALLPPEERARLNKSLAEDPYTLDLQYRIVRPDSVERWVDVRTVPVRDSTGTVLRTVGIARDITPLVQATEQLRTSEAQYRLLFAHNPHPMCVIEDATQRILAVNQAALKHYGYSEEEFMTMTLADMRPPHEMQRLTRVFKQPSLPDYMGTWQHKKRDGTLIDVDVYSTRLQFNGRAATLALALDVTERLRNEARIRQQADLLDQATDAIVVRDLDQRITYWNKSAEQLYGWTAAEAAGRLVTDTHIDDRAAFNAAMHILLTHGEWSGEMTHTTRDGRTVMVESRWTLVRSEEDTPRAIFAINTNITARKKLEQQFLRAQRLESIGTLAGGIAHDLNNVLSPIMLSLGMLRLTAHSKREEKIIATLEQTAQRGADMVRQVLSLARGGEGHHVAVELPTLLDELHQMIGEMFDRSVRIDMQVDADLWQVVGDATQLHQMLLNLCVNARDAMNDRGTLRLRAYNTTLDEQYVSMNPTVRVGDYVCIDVVDSGAGIPPEVLDRIFDPFFTTKEQGKGRGLGLATVQAVVKSHGGMVTVDSEVGKGTAFHVYLPAHLPENKELDVAYETATPGALPYGHGELILVVDDEEAVRLVTQETLESFGYRVLVAEDGVGAVARYAQHQAEIALVLTDMMMPVMDGYSTIRALRRINPMVKIVAASGLAAHGMAAKAAGAGVHDFLQKPYTAEALLQMLARRLQDA